MRAAARVEGPGGEVVWMHPGDLLGRTGRSALALDDPRVSEAHAMVSLRGGTLQLLSLRGLLVVDGHPVDEIELTPGLTVHLADRVALHVLERSLPARLLALRVGDGEPAPLLGSVQSLVGTPPVLLPGYRPDAHAHVWSTGETWMLRPANGAPVELAEGTPVRLGEAGEGVVVEPVWVPLAASGAASTVDAGRLHPSLHVVARYQSVHVHREGLPVLSLSGQPARLVSELVAMGGGPVPWKVLAGEVWRRHSRPDTLRKKLDAALGRLRSKLDDAGVRDDLVRADGTGHLELVLYDGDRIEDLT